MSPKAEFPIPEDLQKQLLQQHKRVVKAADRLDRASEERREAAAEYEAAVSDTMGLLKQASDGGGPLFEKKEGKEPKEE